MSDDDEEAASTYYNVGKWILGISIPRTPRRLALSGA